MEIMHYLPGANELIIVASQVSWYIHETEKLLYRLNYELCLQ